jgi:hypothetical protein
LIQAIDLLLAAKAMKKDQKQATETDIKSLAMKTEIFVQQNERKRKK